MKNLIITIILLLVCFSGIAADKCTSYAYHSVTIKDRDFNVVEELQGNGKPMGLILNIESDGSKFLGVTIGEKSIYEITIVNTVEDSSSQPGVKCILYQGGMKFQGEYIVINVFYIYDTQKNGEIPEYVWIDVDNSPTIMELSGIVKINN